MTLYHFRMIREHRMIISMCKIIVEMYPEVIDVDFFEMEIKLNQLDHRRCRAAGCVGYSYRAV